MVGSGRISLLIDSPLRTVNLAFRGLDPEVRKQITVHTKRATDPIWKETTRGHALNRLQSRVLAGTARVGVSGLSVMLRAGGGVRLSGGGTGASKNLVRATEFGANARTHYRTRSRKGTSYTRRHGDTFGAPARDGNVVYPAARDSIPRIASLVVQTTIRTVHELREKVTR